MRRWRFVPATPQGVRRDRTRGQALVEFAFIFPLIMLLAFGFIDVGRAVFEYNTLTNAARQAARVAMVNQVDPVSGPWNCLANKPVENAAAPNWTFRGCAMAAGATLGVTSADVTVSYAAPPGVSLQCTTRLNIGCIVSVTVTNQYLPITPVAGSIIGPISMSATSEMPIERLFPEQP
jgi:Flp pilus assembly protein TadG